MILQGLTIDSASQSVGGNFSTNNNKPGATVACKLSEEKLSSKTNTDLKCISQV